MKECRPTHGNVVSLNSTNENYDFLGSNPRRNPYCAPNNIAQRNTIENQRNYCKPYNMSQRSEDICAMLKHYSL